MKGLDNKALKLTGCLLLSILLLVSVLAAACSQSQGEDSIFAENTYRQVRIDLPDSVQFVLALEKTNAGKLWMLGTSAETPATHLWELDDGNSWKEVLNISEILALDYEDDCLVSLITKTGKILCFYYESEKLQDGIKVGLIDTEPEPNFRELDLDLALAELSNDAESLHNAILGVFPLNDDRFLIQDNTNSLLVLDCALESIKSVPVADGSEHPQIMSAAELEGRVFALCEGIAGSEHSAVMRTLDLMTGALSSLDSVAHEEMTTLFEEHEKYDYFKVDPSMEGGGAGESRITICISSGVFELTNNGLRKVADAEGTVLPDPSRIVLGCVFDNRDDFFLLCWNANDSETLFSMYKYEMAVDYTEPSKMLRVYALHDDAELRQAIALFNQEYDDVGVILEIGLDNSGMTAEDAIRSLNTELLAGTGPDVLFLDGLPIDSFLEQRVLHDLSEAYYEAVASGLYFENVLSSFLQDGECKVLPLRFTFPLVIAERNTLGRLNDLPTLTAAAREVLSNNPESRVFCDIAILESLFVAFYPSIINNGEINEDALIQFFEEAYSLSLLLETSGSQRSIYPEVAKEDSQDAQDTFNAVEFSRFSLFSEPEQIFIYSVLAEIDHGFNEVIVQNAESDLSTGVLSLNDSNCFQPRSCVAINRYSSEIELAETFIQTLLSRNYQKSSNNAGLSIMKSVFPEIASYPFGLQLEDGRHLLTEPFTDEAYDHYYSLFSSLDTPIIIDSVLQEIIYQQLKGCLGNEISLENAIETCLSRVNFYLQE